MDQQNNIVFYRIINAVVWLYLWLSDVLHPVGTHADFWWEKAKQLFRFNSSFADPVEFVGTAIFPALLWFAIDWGLRRRDRVRRSRVDERERPGSEWSDAEKEQFRRLRDEKRR
jgi:hypothetical protein